MNEPTFTDLYQQAKSQKSPAQLFLEKCAELTKRSPLTVRSWALGMTRPDSLAAAMLAEHFGVSEKSLFPD